MMAALGGGLRQPEDGGQISRLRPPPDHPAQRGGRQRAPHQAGRSSSAATRRSLTRVYYAVKSTLEADRTRPSLQVEPPPRPAEGAACGGSPPPGGARPAAPTYREMTLEEFRRTAERPATPLPLHDFHRPRATGAAPAAPAGNGVSGAPISIPQSAGADTPISARPKPHLSPPGAASPAPQPPAAPHARTDGRARPAESAPASGAPISTVRPVGADAHIRPAEPRPPAMPFVKRSEIASRRRHSDEPFALQRIFCGDRMGEMKGKVKNQP